MSDIHNRKKLLYKFTSNLLDSIIDIDALQLLKDQASIETTPLIYSIMNIWTLGKQTILKDDVIYEYENKLMKIFKKVYTIDNDMLEFFRLVLVTELDQLSLYMDLSEKLSLVSMLVYSCFHTKEEIKPFINFVNDYIPSHNCLCTIYNDVSIVLGGDF